MKNKEDTLETRTLLTLGMIAGPLYIIVSLVQALTRKGFDMRHHAFSILTAGNLGWIERLNFCITGALLVAGAIGIRKVLKEGHGGKWTPRLLAVLGVGFAAAGIFPVDPTMGFPSGTPMTNNSVSWHGMLHLLFASLAFIGLIAACFVMARRFAVQKQRSWAIASRVMGVLLVGALAGVCSGSKGSFITPIFIVTASMGLLWVSIISRSLVDSMKS